MSELPTKSSVELPPTLEDYDVEKATALRERKKRRPRPPKIRIDEGAKISLCGENGALDRFRATVSTGLSNSRSLNLVLKQLASLDPRAFVNSDSRHVNEALAMLDELEPEGGAQTMLAVQMVATHIAAMKCFARSASPTSNSEVREINLKLADKLSSKFVRQVEAFAKIKRGGKQTVHVEHVHVNQGGQAVVGNVEALSRSGVHSDARSSNFDSQ